MKDYDLSVIKNCTGHLLEILLPNSENEETVLIPPNYKKTVVDFYTSSKVLQEPFPPIEVLINSAPPTVKNLPDYEEGKYVIVSSVVASYILRFSGLYRDRTDLFTVGYRLIKKEGDSKRVFARSILRIL